MNELQKIDSGAIERRQPTPIEILEAAVRGGVTAENVAVVEKLTALAREQRKEDAQMAFNRALLAMRRAAPEIYADKPVKDNSGNVTFTYCTPEEINRIVEPLLLSHGFTTMAGQTMDNEGRVTVSLTLLHEAGHSETRNFTVKTLAANRMMDGAKCDAGATTLALRHLQIKMLGLKVRAMREQDDPRLVGDKITRQQAEELQHRVKMTNSIETAFLKFAGVVVGNKDAITLADYEAIPANRYAACDEMLAKKEHQGK